jgi:hypothetical protein
VHLDLVGRGERVRERLEVVLRPLAPGRVSRAVRTLPAGRCEQLLGDRVDELAPGGEQPDVAPVAYRGRCGRSGLEHDGGQATVVGVGGSGQADRAGADDDDGKLCSGHGTLLGSFIDTYRLMSRLYRLVSMEATIDDDRCSLGA